MSSFFACPTHLNDIELAVSFASPEAVKILDTSGRQAEGLAHTQPSLDLTALQSRLDGKLSSTQPLANQKNWKIIFDRCPSVILIFIAALTL